jgi:hypothetical protein
LLQILGDLLATIRRGRRRPGPGGRLAAMGRLARRATLAAATLCGSLAGALEPHALPRYDQRIGW